MKPLSGPQIWQNIFVPEIYKKFLEEIPTTKLIEELIRKEGGEIVLDHGATRSVDPAVHKLLERIAGAFGLKPVGNYDFPNKNLTAVDLQFPNKDGFKWFSTLILYKKFSPELAKAVEDDFKRTNRKLSPELEDLLSKLEKDGALPESQAQKIVGLLLHEYLQRNGKPVLHSTLEIVGKESSELHNALLIGPAFNHVAFTLNNLNVKDWYGQEVIEVLNARLEKDGFRMLPEIQGAPGSLLRQTSTKADTMSFPVEEADGKISHLESPAKFIELIQRGAVKDKNGKIQFEDNKLKVYRGFITTNTEKIYDATKLEKL